MQLPSQTALGGRYRLEREIGRGGMAIVYLARDLKLDRDVAIKVLLGELAFAMGPERFQREIHVVSRLSHPHILPIDDFGEFDGQLYYVMPFITGETLHGRLVRERQLPVQEAIRIAYEVATALEYAHQNGIIHRDIKPENILLQNGEALVADFGIARAITEGGPKLTSTGVTLGTPTYMSPEQAAADPVLDGRSDIYSLGCVLYEMLAGQPPFVGPTAQAIIARHQLDEAPSITIVRGTVPEEVEDIVMQALSKVPADRFATAGEFAEALRMIMTTGARPVRPSQRRSRAKQRQARSLKRYLIGTAVAVPLLAAGAFAAVHFRGRAVASRIGTDSDPNHIAVLYFSDGQDAQLRPLADGFTEALIDELSHVQPLRVISRNGVAPFKAKNVPTDSIQRALKVGTLVTGSVAQSGDRLRLRVSLVDALTGDEIGSKTIERPRKDVFELQDDLAKEVSGLVRKDLGKQVDELVGRRSTNNAQAWEALQRAKQTIVGVDTILATGNVQAAAQRMAAADSELAQVEGLDKKWAAPVIERAKLSVRKAQLLGSGDPAQYKKWFGVAMGHADRAAAMAPNDADALEQRATVRYLSWQNNLAPDAEMPKLIADAEADFRAATKANPQQASAFSALSHLLMTKSMTSEAKLAAQTAYESDPYLTNVHLTIHRLFFTALDLNIKTEAEKWCAVGGQRFPNYFRFTECRLWLFTLKGDKPNVDSLWTVYREYVKRSPKNLQQFDSLKGGMIAAIGLIRAGLRDSALHLAARSRGTPQVDPSGELTYLESIVRAQVGDKNEAINLLTRYLATNPQRRAFAAHDESWWFDDVKDDPRYKALVGSSG